MKFYLIVAKGRKQGMPIPITVDLFLIGSDKVCQLRKDNLGPKQCALVTRDSKVYARDMGSERPTLVNGVVIPPGEEWPLHAGDRIEVGSLHFMIQYREHGLSQRDLEEWASSCLIKKELCEKLNRPNLRVLIDLKSVRRMSSAGVLMLAEVNRWLRPWGSRMAICRIRPEIERVLVTLGVEDITKFSDKKKALNTKW